jgi:alpha-D-ribose 1-methylphosphonate 5-triphosphate synthase subunit PhnI
MYVAVKGGEQAIAQSIDAMRRKRRGDRSVPELSIAQIREQLPYAVDRVMAEGSVFDPQLAALAIKQAGGDVVEAIFLLRAFRTTLPRFGSTVPLETSKMRVVRRVSAIFKDLPGGQILGPSFDYSQRLLDFSLLADEQTSSPIEEPPDPVRSTARETGSAFSQAALRSVSAQQSADALALLSREGLIESDGDSESAHDLTCEPLSFPADRNTRLQNLARADEGFLLAMAYSTQRGYAHSHPFVGDLRVGQVDIEIQPDELGFPLIVGQLLLTECQMVNQFAGSLTVPAQFTRGYGLSIGQNERKAMAMALTDRALRSSELGEPLTAPAQSEEFVLSHSDCLEASGFVQHLKLPHYVDFQSELELIRRLRSATGNTLSGSIGDEEAA